MSAPRQDDKEGLPVRVITHEGTISSAGRRTSESEREFVRWMKDYEPDPEEEEGAPERDEAETPEER